MKKILLLEIRQKDKSFFLAVLNPREVIKLINIPIQNTNQDSNRPWKEKRVRDIATYVAGRMNISDKKDKIKMAKGYIANCPILSLENPFQIYKENENYYIDFPETEDEIAKYHDKITILDGQHRLISFSTEYIDVDMGKIEKYDMGFILFNDLTINEKREIFMITNDRQEKVESNVLKLIKRWLGLLSQKEDHLYKITEMLNKESISPLKGKIIIGGIKIAHGFKAAQIIKILDKSGVYDKICDHNEEQQIKNICIYLNAWEDVYADKFLNPKSFLGKTTGLRYICFLFPVILDILENQHKKYSKSNISDILQILHNMTIENNEAYEALELGIRSESGTVKIARINGEDLKDKIFDKKERFDIFDIN